MKWYNIRYFFAEGFRSLFRHFFHSFAAISVMCACLLIIATFGLIALNVTMLVSDLADQNVVMLFVDSSLSRAEARSIEKEIVDIDNVSSVEFISKEQLLDEYLERMGDDAYVFDGLKDDNPLRDSYRITMKDLSLHENTIERLGQIRGIATINSQRELSDRLIKIRTILRSVSAVLIVLLGGVSIFIIYNTVRLAMMSRKEEIGIMKMIGATDRFIRAPFMIEGAVLGLAAGGLSYLAEWGVYTYIQKQLLSFSSVIELVPFSTFSKPLLIIMLAAGFVLGSIGSGVSIRKFLRV